MVHRPKPGFHVLLYGERQGQTTGALTITVFQKKKMKTEPTKAEEWALVAAPPQALVQLQAAGVAKHRAPFCTPEYFTSLNTLSCSPDWE